MAPTEQAREVGVWELVSWLWAMVPGILLVPLYLGWLGGSAWAIGYRFAWITMVVPPERAAFFAESGSRENKWAGVAILAVLGCLRLYALGAWGTAIVRGNWPDRRRRRLNRAPVNRWVMQSSRRWADDAKTLVGPWALDFLDESLRGRDRPRFCDNPACLRPLDRLGDRMYCSSRTPWIRGHLPLYDHFCHWTLIPVWLDTIKSYLLLLASMIVDALFCFACCIAAYALQETRDSIPVGVCALVSGLIVVGVGQYAIRFQWRRIGLGNAVGTEHSVLHHVYLFAVVVPTPRGKSLRYFNFDGNPWDLGSGMANLRQALGANVWEWPLFWRQPDRVVNYGRGSDRETDYPMFHRLIEVARIVQGGEPTDSDASESRSERSSEYSTSRRRNAGSWTEDDVRGIPLQDIHPAFRRRRATERSSSVDIADMV